MAAEKSPSVFIIILNWNGWRDTLECLQSLLASTCPNYRLVVIDNGSTNDSWERLHAWAADAGHGPMITAVYDRCMAEAGGDPAAEYRLAEAPANRQLTLIQTGENLGFAGGCNLGIRYSLARGADYIWLLNNDTVVAPEALAHLVDFLESSPDYAGATGQIRYHAQPDRIWNCAGSLTWFGAHRYDYWGAPVTATPQSGHKRITFMTGCAALFRAAAFERVGPLTSRFFHGEEDFELCQRLKARGEKLACCYNAIIYHKVNASVSAVRDKSDIGMMYIHYLNRFVDMRTFLPGPVWHIWRLVFLLSIIRRARRDLHPSRRVLWRFATSLLRDSRRLDRVDRSTFEYAIRGQFAP